MARVDGHPVKVGDSVCFKSDVEQSGTIVKIQGDILTLQAGPNGFEGGYIGGSEYTTEYAWDCWFD